MTRMPATVGILAAICGLILTIVAYFLWGDIEMPLPQRAFVVGVMACLMVAMYSIGILHGQRTEKPDAGAAEMVG